ncbi:MAG: hypothetical protein BZY88_10965 [SAR202 cluster bacterium Io17-Chloro-G9]|nr:MAG: hypothetical protein BZY88_10965 [SAR202 cluster bacterium Io17-Chloro-G9]
MGDDYRSAGLTRKQVAMLEYAEFLTLYPSNVTQEHVQELRDVGWTDADVIDIVHITAFFNYMVRIADGLGIELQAGRGWEELTEKLPFKDDTTSKSFGTITPVPPASVPAR